MKSVHTKINIHVALMWLFILCLPLWAANTQNDGRTYFTINQGSVNEIGSGYDSDGAGTSVYNFDGTGFYRMEFPVGAISNSAYTDDGIWFELGGLSTGGGGTQDLWLNVAGDTGLITATSPTDTLNVVGGTGLTTAVTGTTVTLTNTGTLQNAYNAGAGIVTILTDGTKPLVFTNTEATVDQPTLILDFTALTSETAAGRAFSVQNLTDGEVAYIKARGEFVTTASVTSPQIVLGDASTEGSLFLHDGDGETAKIFNSDSSASFSLVFVESNAGNAPVLGLTLLPTRYALARELAGTITSFSALNIVEPLPVFATETVTTYGIYVNTWTVAGGTDTITIRLLVSGSSVASFTANAGVAGVYSGAASVGIIAGDRMTVDVQITAVVTGEDTITTTGGVIGGTFLAPAAP
jgi:hypothetical protein